MSSTLNRHQCTFADEIVSIAPPLIFTALLWFSGIPQSFFGSVMQPAYERDLIATFLWWQRCPSRACLRITPLFRPFLKRVLMLFYFSYPPSAEDDGNSLGNSPFSVNSKLQRWFLQNPISDFMPDLLIVNFLVYLLCQLADVLWILVRYTCYLPYTPHE